MPGPKGLIKGTGSVLLVDDEQEIRDVMSRMLKFFGYDVLVASSGEQALSTYKELGPTIDLVIMDVTMPGMDGLECLQQMKLLPGELRVLFSSGGNRHAELRAEQEDVVKGFLHKPFAMVDFSRQVAEAMSAA